jgi:hypothetical protein
MVWRAEGRYEESARFLRAALVYFSEHGEAVQAARLDFLHKQAASATLSAIEGLQQGIGNKRACGVARTQGARNFQLSA